MMSAEIDQATHDDAISDAYFQGVAAERARITSILELPQSVGRMSQAIALCTMDGLTADQAAKVLAASPTVAAGQPDLALILGGLTTFGDGGGLEMRTSDQSTDDLWKRARQEIERSE
jgi:hypothetical protein